MRFPLQGFTLLSSTSYRSTWTRHKVHEMFFSHDAHVNNESRWVLFGQFGTRQWTAQNNTINCYCLIFVCHFLSQHTRQQVKECSIRIYLKEMGPIRLSEVKLVFLSEPAELRFDHPLVSTERRQIEEVKPFARMTCRQKYTRNICSETLELFLDWEILHDLFALATRNRARLRKGSCLNYALKMNENNNCCCMVKYWVSLKKYMTAVRT